ncbi:MAG TPA: hypothetical protein PK076_03695 [Saprospiraceae bacterium]|nr:hypothetical protein [Saprospiraceae bacterium]HQW55199.1 hypothetical protein [Saprospiraceae bacterium]
MKREVKYSKAAIIIIFVALIRTLSEPFRLQYYSTSNIGLEQLKPFLLAALIAASGLLGMFILSLYGRHKIIILLAVLIICAMLVLKQIYQV